MPAPGDAAHRELAGLAAKPASGAVISALTGMSVMTANRAGSIASPGRTGSRGRR